MKFDPYILQDILSDLHDYGVPAFVDFLADISAIPFFLLGCLYFLVRIFKGGRNG